jgi:ABC-2 type transport system ATP-binding protein
MKILEVNNLTKRYKTVNAVNDISFSLDPGDIHAFLGPNGAGKTTTLRILLDIIKADSGTIHWNLNGHSQNIATLIGYLPEERGLYLDIPILRTLIYLAGIRGMEPMRAKKAAMQWLEKFDLAPRAHEKLQALSKGNQQKIQFIASIIHQPAFAILDEPFSGLDPINQEMFIQHIQELNQQGTTILLSAHQMQLVEKIADKVFLINHGKEVFSGNLSDIYRKHGQKQTFEVTFTDITPEENLRNLQGAESVTCQEANKASITFENGMPVNEIMQQLGTLDHTITHVKSHNSTLHDIFLQLIQKQPAVVNPVV